MKVILICLALLLCMGCATKRKPIAQVDNTKRVTINSDEEREKIWRLAGYAEHSEILKRAETAERIRQEEQARLARAEELRTIRLQEQRKTERIIAVERWQRSQLQPQRAFYFDSGKYNLSIDKKNENNILRLIERTVAIDIRGRTDGKGADESNDQLALKRAVAAKQYLMNLGVPENIISLNYSAENNYVADESNASARAKNRRVEIKFILEPVNTTIRKRNLN